MHKMPRKTQVLFVSGAQQEQWEEERDVLSLVKVKHETSYYNCLWMQLCMVLMFDTPVLQSALQRKIPLPVSKIIWKLVCIFSGIFYSTLCKTNKGNNWSFHWNTFMMQQVLQFFVFFCIFLSSLIKNILFLQ